MDPLLRAATLDPEFWIRRCAHIRQKDGSIIGPKTGKPFVPNKLQLQVLQHYRECQLAGKPCLIMILKPRQKGASTIAEAVIYHHLRRYPGLNGSLMGDIAATSDKVFEMFRRYYEGDVYPWNQGPIDPELNLGDEVTLPNGSKWYKETAGSTNAGRGGTVQVAHMDEVAFFQTTVSKDPTTAYLGSFYKDGPMSLGFATSTANGATGWFYDTWNNTQNAWKKIFAAWFEFDDSTRKFDSEDERKRFEDSLDEDELDEQKLYNVTLEQLNWRRYVINTDYRGDAAKFRQEMPSDPETCFLLSSRPRFHMPAVKSMMAAAATNDTRQRGNLVIQNKHDAIWLPDANGGSVHRQEEPIIGCRYLVSVDTCSGEDQQIGGKTADPDWHDVQVWRQGYMDPGTQTWRNHALVAWHKSQVDTDVLAEIIAGMSFYYGKCITFPEVNGQGGFHIVKLLVAYGVPVFRRKPHTNSSKPKSEEEQVEAYGWQTDLITRKYIIDTIVPLVRQEKIDIYFKEVLEQFRTFVVTEQGKSEAMPGKHDDSVLSAAIGLYNIGSATEYKLARVRSVDLMRLARDPRYMTPDGFRRKIVMAGR
jgi:hypothetical protein